MLRFNMQYKRPIIPFYRTTLYELVQVRPQLEVMTHPALLR